MTRRASKDRGHAKYSWLTTRYSFSFANYYDPDFMGFRALRVINEDVIAAKGGFDFHDHENMEILTWVISGALTHQDSLGNTDTLRANQAQIMSAGTGITHREWNDAPEEPVHLLQIWIEPATYHRPPRYAQQTFLPSARHHTEQYLATPDARHGSLLIEQDVLVSLITLVAGQTFELSSLGYPAMWLQSISAQFTVEQVDIQPGDGLATQDEPTLTLLPNISGDLLVFRLR